MITICNVFLNILNNKEKLVGIWPKLIINSTGTIRKSYMKKKILKKKKPEQFQEILFVHDETFFPGFLLNRNKKPSTNNKKQKLAGIKFFDLWSTWK